MLWILAFVLNLLNRGIKCTDSVVERVSVASLLKIDSSGTWVEAVKPIRRPLCQKAAGRSRKTKCET